MPSGTIPLTPDEFRREIAGHGYNLRGFADFTDTSPHTVERWSTGDLDIPGWVSVILDLLDTIRDLKNSM